MYMSWWTAATNCHVVRQFVQIRLCARSINHSQTHLPRSQPVSGLSITIALHLLLNQYMYKEREERIKGTIINYGEGRGGGGGGASNWGEGK